MKKNQFLFLLVLILSTTLSAQDVCTAYLPAKGTTLTYNNYDKKGKLTNTTTTEVVSIIQDGDSKIFKVHQLISDGKKKNDIENNFKYICTGDQFIVDMQSILNAEQMQGFTGTVVIETENMFIPKNLEPGMELEDGLIKMEAYVEPMTMTIMARSFYREVIAKEEITTPAGTFEAWKIGGNIETKVSFMRFAARTVEWYVEDIGIVRSEMYDNKGKMYGYSELVKISK